MQTITVAGVTTTLVTEAPDWQSPVESTVSLDRSVETGLSNRESRRPYSASLRTVLKYQTTQDSAGARGLVGGLRGNTSQQVAIPFWPGMSLWSARGAMPFTGGYFVAFAADYSEFTVYAAGDEPDWPQDNDFVAPCLFGFLSAASLLEWQSDSVARWSIEFTESSEIAYAMTVASESWSAGPNPGSYATAPDIQPFEPDWDVVKDTLNLNITRRRTGFRRAQATTFYTQAIARLNECRFTLGDPSSIASFIRFWMDHAAAAAVWSPAWMAATTLSADVGSTDTTLLVGDTAALFVGDWLILQPSVGAAAYAQIAAIGSGSITITAAIGAMAAAGAMVMPLLLARVDQPSLTVSFRSPAVAQCRLAYREVPPEYSPGSPESLNATIGALPARAILFEFTASGVTSCWTNYEQSVTYAGQSYTTASFAHGDLRESLNLERTQITLTSEVFANHPWLPLINLTSESPVTVVIRWATVAGASASGAATLFTGQITDVEIKGQLLTATAMPGGSRFDQDLPRLSQSAQCWATLFDAGCGLNAADWKVTAIAATPISSAWPYQLNIASITGAGGDADASLIAGAVFANWFAPGWVEWTPSSGGPTQRRAILGSTAPAAGALTLTLDRWFTGSPNAGDAITLYPGCDQLWTTCGAYNAAVTDSLGRFGPTGKFANQVNFVGAPFRPPANPSVAVRSATNSGGKKP